MVPGRTIKMCRYSTGDGMAGGVPSINKGAVPVRGADGLCRQIFIPATLDVGSEAPEPVVVDLGRQSFEIQPVPHGS